jgi:phospholipase/carboxylesterase
MTDALETRMTRRQFAIAAGCTFASVAFDDGCVVSTKSAEGSDGRLTARPRAGVATSLKSGPLGLGSGGRDGLIRVPSIAPDGQVPLLVFLHGATQRGEAMLRRIGPAAEQLGVAILALDSRGTTWDAIRQEFGEDVVFLNRALEYVFARLTVDPARVAIGGFSDGASYALSIGLANGDLFPRVVACSPGFVMSAPAHGRPRFFVSHGTFDQILPIDQCSRVIVPRLQGMGYDVTFREFEGRHELPPDIVSEALRWTAAGD